MREMEPAKVIALEYSISNDGTRNTLACVDLQLSDAASPLVGHTFSVSPAACPLALFNVQKLPDTNLT